MDTVASRQLNQKSVLAANEWIVWYDHQVKEDGFVDVEIRTQNTTDVVPYLQHNLLKFSFKKVDHKKYLEEKLKSLGYEPPEIS